MQTFMVHSIQIFYSGWPFVLTVDYEVNYYESSTSIFVIRISDLWVCSEVTSDK